MDLRVWIFWLLAGAAAPAWALDLAQAFALAKQADAKYQAVQARTEAEEEVGVARARLLPQIGATGSVGKLWVERSFGGRTFPVSPTDSWNWNLNFRQALYRPSEWAVYQQSQALSEGARLRLGQEALSLLDRLAKVYLEALDALAQLKVAQEDVARYQTILAQAEAAFRQGQGTRVEIEEAKARLDAARAQVLNAKVTWKSPNAP